MPRASPLQAVNGLQALLVPLADEVLLACNPGLERVGEVHDLRVAVNRLRVALACLRELPGAPRGKSLRKTLRRLRDELRDLRDYDVLAGDLAAAAGPAVDAAGLRDLLDAVQQRRQRALDQAQRQLRREHTDRLRRDLYALRHRLQRTTADTAALQARLRPLARRQLQQRLHKIRERARQIRDDDTQALHRLRLQIKKLRYGAELYAPLFARRGQPRFLATLARLQDTLGAAHDASVEHRQLTRLHRRLSAPARALLDAHGAAGLIPAPPLDPQWRDDLLRLRPFWSAAASAGARLPRPRR